MEPYLLSRHVHLCVTDDHVVLLDLLRDKYVGVAPDQEPTLAAAVKGWPRTVVATPPAPTAPPAPIAQPALTVQPAPTPTTPPSSILAKMLAQGMLTTDPAQGKEARPPKLALPTSPLTEPDLETRPEPGAARVARFLRVALLTRLSLRWRSIQSVVERVQARKARVAGARETLDLEAARKEVEIFLYLRPLLFGARDECLYDSLALIEFLACRRLYPTWVFGVQTRPFLAHSWVQHEDRVFNDTPEYIARFTPILAI